MGAAIDVGIWYYSFSSGGWKRTNGPTGTSDGFEGLWKKVSGVWEEVNSCRVYKSSTWQYSWVNIDGELSFLDESYSDFDFSAPHHTAVDYKIFANGDVQKSTVDFGFTSVGQWRTYDCGREYEVKFVEILTGSFVAWTSHPTLNTFLDLTDPATDHTFYIEKFTAGMWESRMTVYVQEKVTQSGGNDAANLDATLEAEDFK